MGSQLRPVGQIQSALYHSPEWMASAVLPGMIAMTLSIVPWDLYGKPCLHGMQCMRHDGVADPRRLTLKTLGGCSWGLCKLPRWGGGTMRARVRERAVMRIKMGIGGRVQILFCWTGFEYEVHLSKCSALWFQGRKNCKKFSFVLESWGQLLTQKGLCKRRFDCRMALPSKNAEAFTREERATKADHYPLRNSQNVQQDELLRKWQDEKCSAAWTFPEEKLPKMEVSAIKKLQNT